ncbi:conserved oligomeric Golgi complex subunit 2 [Ischnura elegans]|uniref:conserved oligomeric Golgi complex subunit 2 n=1 Tax=Ischnura elegans TaxID=197161 RepID=UPI001ED86F63|nr:conserved oligomeric Golgi complex subunit 2 [Ischnura elegans]
MAKEMEGYSLPISSVDLCFDGNVFVQAHFSADLFLQEQRGRATLETMRDDLGSYLKVLRSATLDLIDHDYADFVGLSSSLVGLDKAVGKIRDPLGQLREEVMAIMSSLDEALRGMKAQLEERRALRAKRRQLEARLNAIGCLRLLDKRLLLPCLDGLPVAERSAPAFNQLTFCMEKCPPDDQLNLHASCAQGRLMQLLEGMLLDAVIALQGEKGGVWTSGVALRILRLYASLGEASIAEELVGRHVVAPALDSIVKDASSSGLRLSDVYHSALAVLSGKLGRLLTLTSCENRDSLTVEGFDFLANSFWPQFVHMLQLHLPNVSAPGNPNVFHQRFCETLSFLEELERLCGSSEAIQTLRSKPSYRQFLNSWNLQVYTQIRFQELAACVECAFPEQPYPSHGFDSSSAGRLLGLNPSSPIHTGFWLAPTSSCWQSISRCWHDDVLIRRVGHKFWKMSLQIVARYGQWSKDILEHQLGSVKVREEGAKEDMLLLPLCVHRDVCQLSWHLEHHLLPTATATLLSATSDQHHSTIGSLLARSLDVALEAFRSDVEPLAVRCIVQIISRWSLPHLSQCRDIPRLYRRTNRAHPTGPRPYVSSTLSPPLAFRSLVLTSFTAPEPRGEVERGGEGAWVDAPLLRLIMAQIFSEITLQYHSGVLEVLTSVLKMEQSLRRLKRIRATDGGGEAPSAAADDDEKIRAQLALDVHHFCEQVESAGVPRDEVKQLPQLVELVDNAMRGRVGSLQ